MTIELSPFQCADIAKACHFASEYSFDEKIDAWRTLAALFRACAIVGFAQWQMCGPDLEALLEQRAMLNLDKDSCDVTAHRLQSECQRTVNIWDVWD